MNTAIPIWQILAFLGVFLVITSAWGWFRDQYEPVWTGRLPRFTRRWYGSGARVCFRSDADLADPAWFRVAGWIDEGTDVPWVQIAAPGDEDFPSCWCPVTDLAPYAVRSLRPPFAYAPLRELVRAGADA
jgi:hypothetical protein